MTNEEIIRDQVLAVIGEAGVADVEAYCAANGITLGDWLEAIATRPRGACDRSGFPVDEASGHQVAMMLKMARMLDHAESVRIALSQGSASRFQSMGRA